MGTPVLLYPGQVMGCFARRDYFCLRYVRRSSCITRYRSSVFFRISRKQPFLSCAVQDDSGRDQQLPQSSGTGAALEEKPATTPKFEKQQDGNDENERSAVYNFLFPSKELLPDDKEMSLFDHLEELRERIFISVLVVGACMLGCFAFSKDLVKLLEAPVAVQGVRFLQLSPGEFFFTTLKVSGYCGLLLASPVILYEIIAFVLPGLTRDERNSDSSSLEFFVNYAEGAVESIWSIDQYFEFVLVLMFSTGLSFQVPVIQLLLGQVGLVSGDQMLCIWRYVVVGAVVAAAVLTPSTDPLTQILLAGPLLGLYLGGAWIVKLIGR
ncbi:hypothetical protein HPP92_021196 [Vanilla planifolia]|uniref:Sec-independent protein translocase protein TATC, chloroplastic n=1 Tax=Vanilla planifolia TaxID=51239 RepID=A0A835Q1W2_VANPL|nr:hypothetical protein HPP92_021196 [Vanilla planifolia]